MASAAASRTLLQLLLTAALCPSAVALTLPSTWSSSMVIQRGVPVTLWGMDAPGAIVTLTCTAPWCTAGLKSAPADSTGRFEVKLPKAAASTAPFTIKLTSSKGGSLALSDVLVGDVYVCSGVSPPSSNPPVACDVWVIFHRLDFNGMAAIEHGAGRGGRS